MFVGHYGVAFAVKTPRNKIPLWVLFVAVQLLDFLWAPFVLLGIEKVRFVPGITATNALDLYYMPYTHSLIGAVLYLKRNGAIARKIGIIIFVAALVLIQTSNTFLRQPPSSDRAFAITALVFYTVFAVVAFLLEKRRAISS